MLQVANPTYLYALLGLLVPLAIHLWNQQEPPVRKVGSIQWLVASETSRVSRIRFHQFWLFLLRMTLLVVLCLIMSDLQWKGSSKASEKVNKWVLLEPTLVNNSTWADALRKLGQEGWEIRLADLEFTKVNPENLENMEAPQADRLENYWALLRLLEKHPQKPDQMRFYTYAHLQHFQGKRPSLHLNLDWVVVPQPTPYYFIEQAHQTTADSLALILGISEEFQTYFRKVKVAAEPRVQLSDFPTLKKEAQKLFLNQEPYTPFEIQNQAVSRVQIYYDPDQSLDQAYLQAAWEAVATYLDRSFSIESQLVSKQLPATETDYVCWLSQQALPDSLWSSGAQVLIYQLQPTQRIIQAGRYRQKKVYFLTKKLNTELLTHSDWPEELLRWVTENTFPKPKTQERDLRKIDLAQIRIQDTAKALTKENQSAKTIQPAQSLREPLWILFFLLFFGERWWSTRLHL